MSYEYVSNHKKFQKYLKDSLAWITADEWPKCETLCKVVTSKFIAINDTEKLNDCINKMDAKFKQSTVSFLFTQSLFKDFQLFSTDAEDCVMVLLPSVDELKIDCKAFEKVLFEKAKNAIASPGNDFCKERVFKAFEYVSFQEEDLIMILELLSVQGN